MDELGRLSPEEFQQSAHRPIVLLLDNIRSLQNVGAIFRTADAFNIEALALCGFTGTPPHRELHRAALGAEDTVAWQHFEHAMDALEHYGDQGYRILALEQCEGSVPLQTYEAHPQDRLLLILGNEVNGVDQALASRADVCLEIPQHGTKHSLNVATAAGIALWQLVLPYL
ncbi:MAG: RNA methyltransferase [Bacteroidetes bacterium]|nr:MAG: RNA methyltransferase [Bacteroidota bacterium]